MDKAKLEEKKEAIKARLDIKDDDQSQQKQHQKFHRKIKLRELMLRDWSNWSNSYVPFCGEGDIANELYSEYSKVFGVDIDDEKLSTAKSRMPDSVFVNHDANKFPMNWTETFSLGDFDAYSNPYQSFVSFWKNANKSFPILCFFTDSKVQCMMWHSFVDMPDWGRYHLKDKKEKKLYMKKWKLKCIQWVKDYIGNKYKLVETKQYQRHFTIYWGCVIDEQ
jgi:hypothetical protein